MSTLTKMTRTVKKLEVPRPLKSTTSSAHNRNSMLDVKINSGKNFAGMSLFFKLSSDWKLVLLVVNLSPFQLQYLIGHIHNRCALLGVGLHLSSYNKKLKVLIETKKNAIVINLLPFFQKHRAHRYTQNKDLHTGNM